MPKFLGRFSKSWLTTFLTTGFLTANGAGATFLVTGFFFGLGCKLKWFQFSYVHITYKLIHCVWVFFRIYILANTQKQTKQKTEKKYIK